MGRFLATAQNTRKNILSFWPAPEGKRNSSVVPSEDTEKQMNPAKPQNYSAGIGLPGISFVSTKAMVFALTPIFNLVKISRVSS